MDVRDLLEELFGRIPEHVRDAVDGLSADDLVAAPGAGRNPIGWLVWHLARVQDHHVAELLGRDQVWTTAPWPARFGLDADPDDTGYGHSPEQVARVRPDGPEALGPAGDPRRAAGQRRRRRHPARRAGRVPARPPRPLNPRLRRDAPWLASEPSRITRCSRRSRRR